MSTPAERAVSDDLRLAATLADAADAITTKRFLASDLRVDSKPDRTPVTDADLAVEEEVRRLVAEAGAGSVVGEEGGGSVGAGRCWLIDPIDGTKNFSRGMPVWATLIALLVDGAPQVGMISAPALGRRWWAGAGAGAWTSVGGVRRRISVSGVRSLGDAYLSTTDLESWAEFAARERYLRLTESCWTSRALGDFWSHCLVAEGAIDLAAEVVVNDWDVAAIQVLVTEAGGEFTDLTGAHTYTGGSALSSNGLVHAAALELLRG